MELQNPVTFEMTCSENGEPIGGVTAQVIVEIQPGDLPDFEERILQPATAALAQRINEAFSARVGREPRDFGLEFDVLPPGA